MAIAVGTVDEVYADGMQSRALMIYEMSETSSSGRITVQGMVTVQDSSSKIIDYTINGIQTGRGISDAAIISSGISSSGKQVRITVEYFYYGTYKIETVYFGI